MTGHLGDMWGDLARRARELHERLAAEERARAAAAKTAEKKEADRVQAQAVGAPWQVAANRKRLEREMASALKTLASVQARWGSHQGDEATGREIQAAEGHWSREVQRIQRELAMLPRDTSNEAGGPSLFEVPEGWRGIERWRDPMDPVLLSLEGYDEGLSFNLGKTLKRMVTPGRQVRKAIRYAGAYSHFALPGLSPSTWMTAGQRRRAFGLSDRESKTAEVGAKVARGVTFAAAAVAAGYAAAPMVLPALKGGSGAAGATTKAGALAKLTGATAKVATPGAWGKALAATNKGAFLGRLAETVYHFTKGPQGVQMSAYEAGQIPGAAYLPDGGLMPSDVEGPQSQPSPSAGAPGGGWGMSGLAPADYKEPEEPGLLPAQGGPGWDAAPVAAGVSPWVLAALGLAALYAAKKRGLL